MLSWRILSCRLAAYAFEAALLMPLISICILSNVSAPGIGGSGTDGNEALGGTFIRSGDRPDGRSAAIPNGRSWFEEAPALERGTIAWPPTSSNGGKSAYSGEISAVDTNLPTSSFTGLGGLSAGSSRLPFSSYQAGFSKFQPSSFSLS